MNRVVWIIIWFLAGLLGAGIGVLIGIAVNVLEDKKQARNRKEREAAWAAHSMTREARERSEE